jgi:Flp pilus assembly protein TadD
MRRSPKRSVLLIVTLCVAMALGAGIGCASWRAARLYIDGSAAFERGETSEAVESLERAARLAPGASEIRNHLGLAYAAAGRREDARRAFETALDLDCDNRAARRNLVSLREGSLAGSREPGLPRAAENSPDKLRETSGEK